jgi:ribonuclease P protein component
MRGHPGPPVDEQPSSSPTPPAGERLLPRERLVRRADYLRCYRTGRRRLGGLVILYFAPNSLGHPRIGITATRKVGNAVVRHRLKRRIKEIWRRRPERKRLHGIDLVVHLKPESGKAGFDELASDLQGLLGGIAGRRVRDGRGERRA